VKVLFFLCVIATVVSDYILRRTTATRYDLYRANGKYMNKLFKEARENGEKKILMLFTILLISIMGFFVLSFVAF